MTAVLMFSETSIIGSTASGSFNPVHNIVIVPFFRGHKFDLCVGGAGHRAAVSDPVLEEKGEGLPEGLLKAGPHEAVDDGVDGGVGVGHAVGPRLDLVGGVVGLVLGIEGLKEDKELDGTPAHGEQEDDHHHHPGHLAAYADGPLRQQVDLETLRENRGKEKWAEEEETRNRVRALQKNSTTVSTNWIFSLEDISIYLYICIYICTATAGSRQTTCRVELRFSPPGSCCLPAPRWAALPSSPSACSRRRW